MREIAAALTGFREALTGGRDEATSPVEVNELVRRAAAISGVGYDASWQGRPARLRLALSLASEPLVALTSPGLLAVLAQVIDSIAELMPDGGEIEIRTGLDQDRVFVSVRDVESGSMPNVERGALIRALSREGTARLALSLATAQAFAERHGGMAQCVLGDIRGTELVLRFQRGPRSPVHRSSALSS
jgi:K+-sensing histidine kinase KdpD